MPSFTLYQVSFVYLLLKRFQLFMQSNYCIFISKIEELM